jgi:hypothetical protein
VHGLEERLKGSWDVFLTPGNWKSAPPTLEMSAKSIVTIEPGGITAFLFT